MHMNPQKQGNMDKQIHYALSFFLKGIKQQSHMLVRLSFFVTMKGLTQDLCLFEVTNTEITLCLEHVCKLVAFQAVGFQFTTPLQSIM